LLGFDDLEDHQEYAAFLIPSSTTFKHSSAWLGINLEAKKPRFVRHEKTFQKPKLKPSEAISGSAAWHS
jgi:hypothetical protein